MRRGDDVLLEEGGCFFDGASSILSTDSDAGDVSEVDNDDFDEASSVSSIGSDASKNMAAQLQLKYLSPPVFRAERDDDAFDGLNRYETTSAYNKWDNAELRKHFGMYLDGAARKWFLCSTIPQSLVDLVLDRIRRFASGIRLEESIFRSFSRRI